MGKLIGCITRITVEESMKPIWAKIKRQSIQGFLKPGFPSVVRADNALYCTGTPKVY